MIAAPLTNAEMHMGTAAIRDMGLTPSSLCCNHSPYAEGGAGSRVLTFMVDKGSNGRSTAQTSPMSSVHGHLLLVDAVKTPGSPQQQGAHLYQGTTPALLWYDVGGIGVFYTWDTADVMIVLVGAIANPPPPSFGDFYQDASGRL
jgi:hypothetical protein